MLCQYTDNPERSSNFEMYSYCDRERDSFSENCVVDFMVAESWQCKNRNMDCKHSRNKIYFVKDDNCKDDILCGRMFTVENGHSN